MKLFRCIIHAMSFAVLIASHSLGQETVSRTFELRYVSHDEKADGETDFKGTTEIFDTNKRVEFLRRYGEYARNFFDDPGLDTLVVKPGEARDALQRIKPQPLPVVRIRIPLEEWRWTAWKPGFLESRKQALDLWEERDGVHVKNGALVFMKETTMDLPLPELDWRFSLQGRFKLDFSEGHMEITLTAGGTPIVTLNAKDGKLSLPCDGKTLEWDRTSPGWHSFLFEVDLTDKRVNLYMDEQEMADFVPLLDGSIRAVDGLRISGVPGLSLDDLRGTAFRRTGDVRGPIEAQTFLDESFEIPPDMENWHQPDYDDGGWRTARLPHALGGERYAGFDLYLRRIVTADITEKAILYIETMDPGGEIWINGEVTDVVHDRYPIELDVTGRLVSGENTLAIRIRSRKLENVTSHSPRDPWIGWNMGRARLDLAGKARIEYLFARTLSTKDPASTLNTLELCNEGGKHFKGKLALSYTPWFPEEEGHMKAEAETPVHIRPYSKGTVEVDLPVPSPRLWTWDQPRLYKVHAVLRNEKGDPVDDFVTTTGLRIVDQDGGAFRVNGRAEMANGAQIMGFRMPFDAVSRDHRCAPAETLMTELLQVQRMNGNLLRVHVHCIDSPADGINDPRFPEMCDQLGIMLIWLTPSWIREGEAFAVDFSGYPKYMRQVINHPSIVIWEASNHPNRFKKYDHSESFDFFEKVHDTIYSEDPSRLISATSHLGHTHFANDAGTIDHKGKPIQPPAAYTAPMMTRGNQDSITGYGKDWSRLRNWPNSFARSFLDSPERAYFNFEHEESIGQPNWSLCKGKPWYLIQSYEWGYDKGSIGRRLQADEWLESQAWQAFSAWESMKKQMWLGYDGFSWCCLHGGSNCGTYKKPLIDCLGHAKLAYHVNRMAFQRIWAGSMNVDVALGPNDAVPVFVFNLDEARTVDVIVTMKTMDGARVDGHCYESVAIPAGRSVTDLDPFKPETSSEGYFVIEYTMRDSDD